jgi:hypothetical protein
MSELGDMIIEVEAELFSAPNNSKFNPPSQKSSYKKLQEMMLPARISEVENMRKAYHSNLLRLELDAANEVGYNRVMAEMRMLKQSISRDEPERVGSRVISELEKNPRKHQQPAQSDQLMVPQPQARAEAYTTQPDNEISHRQTTEQHTVIDNKIDEPSSLESENSEDLNTQQTSSARSKPKNHLDISDQATNYPSQSTSSYTKNPSDISSSEMNQPNSTQYFYSKQKTPLLGLRYNLTAVTMDHSINSNVAENYHREYSWTNQLNPVYRFERESSSSSLEL